MNERLRRKLVKSGAGFMMTATLGGLRGGVSQPLRLYQP